MFSNISGGLSVWKILGHHTPICPSQHHRLHSSRLHEWLCVPEGSGQRQLWKGKEHNVYRIFSALKYYEVVSLNSVYVVLGDACWTQRKGPIFCYKGPEEGCGADGRWCGVYNGGETSVSFSLGKPFPHTPLLHFSVKGECSSRLWFSINQYWHLELY